MKMRIPLVIAAACLLCFTSCKKIVSSVFPGTDFTLDKITFTIPAIPIADSTHEFEAGSFTTHFDVDSAIKAHTAGVFGIGVVEYIKVDKVVLTAHNTDGLANLSAIKSFRLTIASDSKSTTSNMLTVNIPANAGSSYTDDTDGENIVDYLKGNSFTNTAYGTIRKPTFKSLTVDMVITLKAR